MEKEVPQEMQVGLYLHARSMRVEWSRWSLGAIRPNRVEAEDATLRVGDGSQGASDGR